MRELFNPSFELILGRIIRLFIIDQELVEYLLVVKHFSAIFIHLIQHNANV